MIVKDINLEDIKVVENSRITIKDKDLSELMSSIKQYGLEQPIGVFPRGSHYEIVYGHRRYNAFKKLGRADIPCVIVDKSEKKDLIIMNLIENIQRKDISPLEIGRLTRDLMKKEDMTLPEISAKLSISKSRLEMCLSLYNSIPGKLHDRVKFMPNTKSGQRDGDIPASLMARIFEMKRSYHFNTATVEALLREVRFNNLVNEDMRIIGLLLNKGMSPLEAFDKLKDYQCYRVDVIVERNEMKNLLTKYNTDKRNLLSMVAYGLIPPLKKPSFIKIKMEK